MFARQSTQTRPLRRAAHLRRGGPGCKHEFTCMAVARCRPPRSHSQDMAGGNSSTSPPPPLGRRPQARWIAHKTRGTHFLHARSTPFSNAEEPHRGCAAGQHAQHFGLFVPQGLLENKPKEGPLKPKGSGFDPKGNPFEPEGL